MQYRRFSPCANGRRNLFQGYSGYLGPRFRNDEPRDIDKQGWIVQQVSDAGTPRQERA